jgi:hypothetical protein
MIDFTKKDTLIELNFINPIYISRIENKCFLYINFLNSKYFIKAGTNYTFLPYYTI